MFPIEVYDLHPPHPGTHEDRLRVIGISHTQILPLPRHTQKALQKLLEQRPGQILAEEPTAQFVPKKFRAKALELEGPVGNRIKDFYQNLARRRLSKWKMGALLTIGLTEEVKRHILEEMGARPQVDYPAIPKKSGEKYDAHFAQMGSKLFHATPQELRKALGGLAGVRSYFMAHHIMEEALLGRNVTVIVGQRHARQIAKFIQSPKLMARYGKRVRQYLKPVDEFRDIGERAGRLAERLESDIRNWR